MQLKKNIILGKINLIIFTILFVNSTSSKTFSENKDIEETFAGQNDHNPHNVDGNNPNGGEDPAGDGEELKELKRSLRDVGGVVGIPSLGQIARKFSGK